MASALPPSERRSSLLVAAYVAISLLLLVVGERLPTAALRSVGAILFMPFDRVVLMGDRMVGAWRENADLHKRVVDLELENGRLRDAGFENVRLREQLALPEWRGLPLHPVEVLALAGEPLPDAATLSAGANHGIQIGDAVLTSDGLVGRVIEVYPTLSRAVLLTDPNAAVACEVESTGVNGVLRFTIAPTPRLLLTAVPLADTIRVGERVVTSALSRRYRQGIPVGRVVRVGRDPTGLMQEVEVQPAARLSRLRHAFVTSRPPGLGPTAAESAPAPGQRP